MSISTRALFLIDQHSQWALAYAGTYKNVHVQTRPFEPLLTGDSVEHGLRNLAEQLMYYDIALVAVSAQNLSWVRSQLHYARSFLRTPIIAVVQDLQSVAIQDLLDAGAADFIMNHSFITELSIRVRLLQRRRFSPRQTTETISTESQSNGVDETNFSVQEDHSLEEYTAAVATRFAVQSQPFQYAKRSMVHRFEKAYISAALVRNQGNITRAARAAQKHRRSFWELMRKHNIDAEIFRESACPDQPSIRKISRH